MQNINDLDLMELPVEEPNFAEDPLPRFQEAKRQHPWLAKSSVGYLVHEYQAIKDLYHMDDKLTLSVSEMVEFMGAKGSPWGTLMEEMMIAKQGEEHARLRSNVADAFTPRSINRHRPLMRSTVSSLLDEWAPRGAFDFAEFSSNFPIRVMCKVIGASPDVVPSLREALETQGLSYSMIPSLLPKLEESLKVLWKFVDELVIERGTEGDAEHGDLLDELIAANTQGLLSDYELRNLLVFLFGAGYDTSKNMLTFIMYEMLQRPQHWERCAEDFEYATKVMNETFRYHSVSNVPRTVKEDVVYRDTLIPKGTMLNFVLTLSGRDPEAFENPDDFEPECPHQNRHIAFGLGAHMCLGQYLARAQIEEGLHLIAQRIKNPRLAGEIKWRPFLGVWGLRSLPIEFDPA